MQMRQIFPSKLELVDILNGKHVKIQVFDDVYPKNGWRASLGERVIVVPPTTDSDIDGKIISVDIENKTVTVVAT